MLTNSKLCIFCHTGEDYNLHIMQLTKFRQKKKKKKATERERNKNLEVPDSQKHEGHDPLIQLEEPAGFRFSRTLHFH